MQWDMGWKLYAIGLLFCGQIYQKNISFSILSENLKRKQRTENARHMHVNYAMLVNKI